MKKILKGEPLSLQDTLDKKIFILLSGKLGIIKGGHLIASFDEEGAIVGELAAILNKPRTATVLALEDSVVMELDMDVDSLIVKHPDVVKKLLISLASRLDQTTTDLYGFAKFAHEKMPHLPRQ